MRAFQCMAIDLSFYSTCLALEMNVCTATMYVNCPTPS